MMMRYQRMSPDCVPLTNAKKPTMRAITKDDLMTTDTNITTTTTTTSSTVSSLDPKPFRFRSTSPSSETRSPGRTPSPSRAGSGDVLLQWGQRKRSRVSRTEIRVVTDESSSSVAAQARQAKVLRRAAHAAAVADKSMPPPPPPLLSAPSSSSTSSFSNGRLRKEISGLLPNRNLEDRSTVVNGSPSRSTAGVNGRGASRSTAGKRSPPREKSERKMPSSSGRLGKDDKANGSSSDRGNNHIDSALLQSEQLGGAAAHNTSGAAEKGNFEVVEWPRIYLALSRKEKEDDFLAMKGTKLPQRPKKRAKNIDRTLQYCFPGMWLSDLTRNRYEVREKKCVKKQKRRGLKGMESVESESE